MKGLRLREVTLLPKIMSVAYSWNQTFPENTPKKCNIRAQLWGSHSSWRTEMRPLLSVARWVKSRQWMKKRIFWPKRKGFPMWGKRWRGDPVRTKPIAGLWRSPQGGLGTSGKEKVCPRTCHSIPAHLTSAPRSDWSLSTGTRPPSTLFPQYKGATLVSAHLEGLSAAHITWQSMQRPNLHFQTHPLLLSFSAGEGKRVSRRVWS